MELLIMHSSTLSSYLFLLKPKSLPQHSLLKKKNPSPNMKGQILHPQKIKRTLELYTFLMFTF